LLLISIATGLDIEEIKDANWESIYDASNSLADYFLTQSEKFYNDFIFNGQKYRFIDLDNLTFGEFIDIDEFLSRPLTKRQSELNHLMALFYREVGDDNKLVKYDASKVGDRALLFKMLPVKYLKGSMSFFFAFREHITKKYPLLFSSDGIQDNLETEKTFEGFWGWYATLIYLSNENILQVQEVAQRHLLEIFNYLTYMKDLNMLRERELKKQLKK
jgi:hypothetical protein